MDGGLDEALRVLRQERSHEGRDMGAVWIQEPDIPRVAKGVKERVNRLKGLGNAIVPQVAAEIIRAMIEVEERE
jgi:DNA (cytosine-5)-methyltransferase 1